MIQFSTDKSKLQIDIIHRFLTETYWAKGRTVDEVETTIDNSLCFGVYLNDEQIGFARVVTDYTVFVYLMDVFILPQYRNNGYSKATHERGDWASTIEKLWWLVVKNIRRSWTI